MKRIGHLFERIVDWNNLRLAFCRAARGKRNRESVRTFARDLDGNLARLAEGLRAGSLTLGRSNEFVIFDPKERTITAPWFEERVLHHAVMNVCEPVFGRWLVHDTYACRRGRGRLVALHRARELAGHYPFFLKLDIRKYFHSISHSILLGRLERIFKDRRLLDLFGQIVGSFQTDAGRGLPIGALTSQHFANFYLGWFDRYAKESLRAGGYVRYMDDMLLWGTSSEVSRDHLHATEDFLATELELQLKPTPYINRSSLGAQFLGCRVFPGYLLLNRRSRDRFRRKLGDLERRYLQGEIDELELQTRGTALLAFVQAGGVKSWKFRQAVLEQLPVSGRRPAAG